MANGEYTPTRGRYAGRTFASYAEYQRVRRADRQREQITDEPAQEARGVASPELSASAPDVDIQTEVAPPAVERPRRQYVSTRRSRQQAEATAAMLLMILDSMVSMAFGRECAMDPVEHETMAEPLSRMLMRMDPTASAAIEKWTDPLLFLFGLAAWGIRVAEIATAKARQKKQLEATGVATLPTGEAENPGNGREADGVPPAGPGVDIIGHVQSGVVSSL